MMQLLLFISYAILAAAIMVVPPRLFGIDPDVASLGALIFFLLSWQLTQWFLGLRADEEKDLRLDILEELNRKLRKELTEIKEELESGGSGGGGSNKKIVSEMKMLKTLLGQVMKKETALAATKSARGEVEEPPVEDTVVEMSASEIEALEETGNIPETAIEEKGAEKPEAIRPAAPVVDDDATTVDVPATKARPTPKEPVKAAAGPRSKPPANAPKRKIRLIKSEDQLLKVVRSSLSENRVDLYLQPIVGLPSRRAAHFECYSRVRDEDGNIVLPRHYMKVAEKSGLVGTLDNLLLFRLIQLVRKLGRRRPNTRFFCNMSQYSLNDKEFFPQFVEFMMGNEEFKDRLVFEISQADFEQLDDNVLDMLAQMGDKGFFFSMDQVTQMELDVPMLARQNFKYLKVDMGKLVEAMNIDDIPTFASSLMRSQIKLIASRMENESDVLQALDSQIDMAQGYLFGEPMSATDLDKSF